MTQTLQPTLTPPPVPPDAPAGAWMFCPTCGATLATANGPMRCPDCNWKGEAYAFAAKQKAIDVAETALPDDAACLHHPSKRATAVCAGTGDYICALCTIDLNGQTYSADYLNNGGNEIARKAFTATLPRPDGRIYLYFLLLVIPWINVVTAALAFVWIPHAFVLYRRVLRMRREDPLYARLVGKFAVVAIPVLLAGVSVLWLVGMYYAVQGILELRARGFHP